MALPLQFWFYFVIWGCCGFLLGMVAMWIIVHFFVSNK
jgi:hypothetical protein